MVRKRRRRRDSERVSRIEDTQARDSDTRPGDAPLGLGGELKSLLGAPRRSGNLSSAGRPSIKGGAIGTEEEEEEDIRALFRGMKEEEAAMELRGRECPVPRPRGRIGELLGFGRNGRRQGVESDDTGRRVR